GHTGQRGGIRRVAEDAAARGAAETDDLRAARGDGIAERVSQLEGDDAGGHAGGESLRGGREGDLAGDGGVDGDVAGGGGVPAAVGVCGLVVMATWLATAGLTVMLPEVAGLRLPLVKSRAIVSAVLSFRLVKVATPLATVTAVVPSSGPVPLCSAAVTCV